MSYRPQILGTTPGRQQAATWTGSRGRRQRSDLVPRSSPLLPLRSMYQRARLGSPVYIGSPMVRRTVRCCYGR